MTDTIICVASIASIGVLGSMATSFGDDVAAGRLKFGVIRADGREDRLGDRLVGTAPDGG